MAWFFPDDEARPHACAALFGLFAERYSRHGRVDVVRRPALVAAAMWRWPAEAGTADGDGDVLPSVPGLMSALLGARAAQIGGAMAGISELRPPEPYAYLHVLGVDPAVQGGGLGSELLERGLAAARDAGLAVCLETMNPGNVPFYRSHGLEVRHKVQLAHGGPTVWAMGSGS
jgi:ribosomal protein S18 acetylase RimI-like enzyme